MSGLSGYMSEWGKGSVIELLLTISVSLSKEANFKTSGDLRGTYILLKVWPSLWPIDIFNNIIICLSCTVRWSVGHNFLKAKLLFHAPFAALSKSYIGTLRKLTYWWLAEVLSTILAHHSLKLTTIWLFTIACKEYFSCIANFKKSTKTSLPIFLLFYMLTDGCYEVCWICVEHKSSPR